MNICITLQIIIIIIITINLSLSLYIYIYIYITIMHTYIIYVIIHIGVCEISTRTVGRPRPLLRVCENMCVHVYVCLLALRDAVLSPRSLAPCPITRHLAVTVTVWSSYIMCIYIYIYIYI